MGEASILVTDLYKWMSEEEGIDSKRRLLRTTTGLLIFKEIFITHAMNEHYT